MKTICCNKRCPHNLVYVQHLTEVHTPHLVTLGTNTRYYPRKSQLHYPHSWKWPYILIGGHAVAHKAHQTLYLYWVRSLRASHLENPSMYVTMGVARKKQCYTLARLKLLFFNFGLGRDFLLSAHRPLNHGDMIAKARHLIMNSHQQRSTEGMCDWTGYDTCAASPTVSKVR